MRTLMGVIKDRHGTYYARKKVPKNLEVAVAKITDSSKSRVSWLAVSLPRNVVHAYTTGLDSPSKVCSPIVLMSPPAPIPAIRSARCIIYCMSCGRSTSAATYVVEGLFGWLPYGRITNRLHCLKGCGDRFGMVLPIDAPTPREFAERYDLAPHARPLPQTTDANLEGDCRFRLIEVGKAGTFLKVYAKSEAPEIVEWGFDFLLKRFANQHGGPPHLVVAHGAQWSRDSKRDYKVVAGKVVEALDEEDDDEDEYGDRTGA